jgi:hypothetical protein
MEDEVGGTCDTHGKGRGVYRVLVGRPEGKRPLEDVGAGGRITRRWTLGKQLSMGRGGFGWLRIGSSGGIFVSTVMNFRVS